jgi:hypothetical protein
MTPDQTTGIVPFTVNSKSSLISTSNGDASQVDAMGGEYFTVTADNRAVTIGTSTTYHKGPDGTRVVDGPNTGDTIYSTNTNGTINGNWISFTAAFSGSWKPWGPPTTKTIFDPNDPDGNITRTVGDPAVTWSWSPQESEDWEMGGLCEMPVSSSNGPITYPVQYTATSLDTPSATATTPVFVMTVHNPLENFVTTNTIFHPTDSDTNVWSEVCEIDNDSAATPSASATQAINITKSISATLGSKQTLTAPEVGSFEANESITIGQTVTTTVSTTQTFPGAPWSVIYWYVAQSYTEKQGTCDVYGVDGFDGTQTWDAITNISTVPSIKSITTATYPH